MTWSDWLGALCLVLYAGSSLAIGHGLAARWLPAAGMAPRALATLVVSACWLTLVFHGLLALSRFDRLSAALAMAAGLLGLRALGISPREIAAGLARDARGLARTARVLGRGSGRALALVFGVLLLCTAAAALLLPPLAWDTLTYHYVKAALWVQSGGPIGLAAPGGWSFYAYRSPGGELFAAWAMLPFGHDLLAGGFEVVFWLAIALALCCIGAELGLRLRHRLAAGAYALFLPACWLAVGSGYVDLTLTVFGLAGAAFGARFARTQRFADAFLSTLAFALAAGVKLTALAGLALAPAMLLATSLRDPAARRPGLVAVGLGGLVAAAIVGPPLLHNWLELGFPFEVPVEIAGWRLGPANPAIDWYMGQLGEQGRAFSWTEEAKALAPLFDWPTRGHPHLSALTALVVALAPVGALRLLRDDRGRAGALAFAVLPGLVALLGFYQPDFGVVRRLFSESNGRFLLPAVACAPLLALLALPRRGRARDALAAGLLAAALLHVALFLPRGLSPEAVGLVIALATGGLLGAMATLAATRAGGGRAGFAAGAAGLLLLLGVLSLVRESEIRDRLLAESSVLHPTNKYWLPAARALDDAEVGGRRIAVTSGPFVMADSWLWYHLLGRSLQNTLHYVPISTNGAWIPFAADEARFERGDFEAWARRLLAAGITDVVAFEPASVELGWMLTRPALFEPIAVEPGRWGAFRLRRDALAAGIGSGGSQAAGAASGGPDPVTRQHAKRR